MMQVIENIGAGEGNRTLVISLEGLWRSNNINAHSDKGTFSPALSRKENFVLSECGHASQIGKSPQAYVPRDGQIRDLRRDRPADQPDISVPVPTFERREGTPAKAEVGTREWWRDEARRTKTDWSSLLRQRARVLWWIRAGRPPLSQWVRDTSETEDRRS
jgi:hypothetical protein